MGSVRPQPTLELTEAALDSSAPLALDFCWE